MKMGVFRTKQVFSFNFAIIFIFSHVVNNATQKKIKTKNPYAHSGSKKIY